MLENRTRKTARLIQAIKPYSPTSAQGECQHIIFQVSVVQPFLVSGFYARVPIRNNVSIKDTKLVCKKKNKKGRLLKRPPLISIIQSYLILI